ncbi:cytochrome P450 4d8 [Culex quinquefasciatus]|uniref:cytochrome P450 4d8 n=1 Tax=Culex quinquefasciatus TaxID=7176 RepID=UPI0018E30797|nr:cytochrome P450 4d8 [Culex quinquefasciatus]
MLLQAVLAGVVSYVVVKFVLQRNQLKKIAAHFGGPKPLPVIGNLLEFNTDVPGIFEKGIQLLHRHGPDMFVWGLLNQNVLVMSSATNAEKVLLAKATQKSVLYSFLQPWLRTGLLLSSGEKWFQRRRIITPTFHFKILDQFAAVFNREADTMVGNLRRHTGREEFDIYAYVTLMALDSICETSMGISVNAQNDPNNKYVQNVKRMSVLFLLQVVNILGGYPTLFSILHPHAYEQRRIVRELHQFTDSVIARRRQQLADQTADLNQRSDGSEKQRMTFLDLLLNVTSEGEPLSDTDIREEVDTFMFEGHDTTTSGISFAIYELARNPVVQDKIYDEIVSILGKDPNSHEITFQVLQEFKYLEMVIKETLRLYPSVPFIGRNVVEPIKLDGITLPPGQDIIVSIYMIHRNPRVFPDPERFDPERFADGAESRRGPYDYIPFSAGARNCIGQRFAMMELKVTLIKLIVAYRILPGESMAQLRLKTDLVLRPDRGIPVKIVARV